MDCGGILWPAGSASIDLLCAARCSGTLPEPARIEGSHPPPSAGSGDRRDSRPARLGGNGRKSSRSRGAGVWRDTRDGRIFLCSTRRKRTCRRVSGRDRRRLASGGCLLLPAFAASWVASLVPGLVEFASSLLLLKVSH